MMRPIPAVGAPQPWPPPPPPPPPSTNATDNKSLFCTPGICTLNCPQWCGSLFLPPPPPFLLDSSDNDDDGAHISPLMAALIAVLAAAFLILFYYTVLSRFFRRRRRRQFRRTQILNHPATSPDDADIRLDSMVQDPARPAAGLDDSFIRQITVFRYRRADGLIDSSDCAVCLSEFKEEENLRLMPNCEHAFHIPCIDTWLKSHSSCPLCRATMNPLPARPADPAGPVSVSAMQVQRSNDVVLVVREVGDHGGEVIVCHEVEGGREDEDEERGNGEEGARKGEIHRR